MVGAMQLGTELVYAHSLLNHDQRGKLVSEGKNRYQLMKVEEEEGGGGEKTIYGDK